MPMVVAAVGTSLISDTVKAALTSGFNNATASMTDVMEIYVPCVIGIVALTAAVSFAVKKIKGALASAS